MTRTGRFTGRVALITGAGRGQGRAHAERFAAEGADVVVCDLAGGAIDTVPYALGSAADLEETARLVRAAGGTPLAVAADVRDTAAMAGVVEAALERFGRIDVLVANAGIAGVSSVAEMTDDAWGNMIDVNLTGAFKSMRAVVGSMVDAGYGRIVATASTVGRQGSPGIAHYVASKWGLIGLVKSLALEVADSGVTVNAVCPAAVDTPMIQNATFHRLFLPDRTRIEREDVVEAFRALHAIPEPWLSPDDVADAVLFLASDQARLITGEALPVALGWNARQAA